MARISNLVLSVNTVSKTFTPLRPYQGKDKPAAWQLADGVTPLNTRLIEIGMSRNSNGTTLVPIKVTVPHVVNDPDIGPKRSSVAYFTSDRGFVIPANAVQAQIDELHGTVAALLPHAVVVDFVRKNEPAI